MQNGREVNELNEWNELNTQIRPPRIETCPYPPSWRNAITIFVNGATIKISCVGST